MFSDSSTVEEKLKEDIFTPHVFLGSGYEIGTMPDIDAAIDQSADFSSAGGTGAEWRAFGSELEELFNDDAFSFNNNNGYSDSLEAASECTHPGIDNSTMETRQEAADGKIPRSGTRVVFPSMEYSSLRPENVIHVTGGDNLSRPFPCSSDEGLQPTIDLVSSAPGEFNIAPDANVDPSLFPQPEIMNDYSHDALQPYSDSSSYTTKDSMLNFNSQSSYHQLPQSAMDHQLLFPGYPLYHSQQHQAAATQMPLPVIGMSNHDNIDAPHLEVEAPRYGTTPAQENEGLHASNFAFRDLASCMDRAIKPLPSRHYRRETQQFGPSTYNRSVLDQNIANLAQQIQPPSQSTVHPPPALEGSPANGSASSSWTDIPFRSFDSSAAGSRTHAHYQTSYNPTSYEEFFQLFPPSRPTPSLDQHYAFQPYPIPPGHLYRHTADNQGSGPSTSSSIDSASFAPLTGHKLSEYGYGLVIQDPSLQHSYQNSSSSDSSGTPPLPSSSNGRGKRRRDTTDEVEIANVCLWAGCGQMIIATESRLRSAISYHLEVVHNFKTTRDAMACCQFPEHKSTKASILKCSSIPRHIETVHFKVTQLCHICLKLLSRGDSLIRHIVRCEEEAANGSTQAKKSRTSSE